MVVDGTVIIYYPARDINCKLLVLVGQNLVQPAQFCCDLHPTPFHYFIERIYLLLDVVQLGHALAEVLQGGFHAVEALYIDQHGRLHAAELDGERGHRDHERQGNSQRRPRNGDLVWRHHSVATSAAVRCNEFGTGVPIAAA